MNPLKILFFSGSMLFQILLYCQVNISGFVEDRVTGERLPGVNVYAPAFQVGTSTNAFGYFHLALLDKESPLEVIFSFMGYASEVVSFTSLSDSLFLVKLQPGLELQEITVYEQTTSQKHGKLQIPVNQFVKIPSLFGEADVLRSFQLMPGVQGGKEGTSGIYVRGGSPDQNLFLLDDIPLYYVNHFGGFVSVFNPDALKSLDLYKGGFPARYGGRNSAVMDIRTKDGNLYETKGNITAGIISSRFLLEGPIQKNKSSYMLSARRSFFDMLTRGYYLLSEGNKFTAGYNLYDINAKVNYILDDKNRLYLSWYSGRDRIFIKHKDSHKNPFNQKTYQLQAQNRVSWGNHSLALRWNHLLTNNVFINNTLGFTNFYYNFEHIVTQTSKSNVGLNERISSLLNSGIRDLLFKSDIEWFYKQHKINFGASGIIHRFTPTASRFKHIENSINHRDTLMGDGHFRNYSYNLYVSDQFDLFDFINFNIGLHYAGFVTGEKTFHSLQPRLTSNIAILRDVDLALSYSRMTQPVHLLSSNDNAIPTDLWVPATSAVSPQNSNIFAMGFSGETGPQTKINWSVEAFYKQMDNLIEFTEGASFFTGVTDWQQKVEKKGKGTVKGIEVLLMKNTGKTTGWMGYTLSHNAREFEHLNSGNPFPYRYNRLHDFSIQMNQQLNPKIDVSATWVLSSGIPVTLPYNKYYLYVMDNYGKDELDGGFDEVHVYSQLNNARMPVYHKLDLNVSFHKELAKGKRILMLGLYNAYNRLNPYYLFFDKDENNNIKLYSVSMFPMIPSISYSYSF
jgi:hypothetical protein